MGVSAFQLLVLLTLLAFTTAGKDANTTDATPAAEAKKPAPERLSSRTMNLYVNQLDTIPLQEDIEQAMLDNDACRFVPKTPTFHVEAQQHVSVSGNFSQQALLLNRLRTVEDEDTERMILAGKHIFVLSNVNWISVYSTHNLKPITKYSIPERTPEHFPFRFNDEVLLVTEESVVICNFAGKRSVPKAKRPVGIPLQVGPSFFIVMTTSEIVLYEFTTQAPTATIRQVITHAVVMHRFPGARALQWVRCKVFDKYLYCLDADNGLFQFNPTDFLQMVRITEKDGCFDFIEPANQPGVFLLQCLRNGEVLIERYPQNGKKVQPIPHVIHKMVNMPLHDDLLVEVQRSMVTIASTTNPDKVTVLNYNEPLVDLVFQKEDVLLDDQSLKKRYAPLGKNITVRTSNSTPTQTVSQTEQAVFLYILFKNRVSKFSLKFSAPRLECLSPQPLTVNLEVRLFNTNNQKQILPLTLSVSAGDAKPPSKYFLIVGLMVAVLLLIIFIGVIYHYEHLERRLNTIYRNIKIKEEKKKGYNVEPAPV